MCAVPAQVAGVERIVVCTPPAGRRARRRGGRAARDRRGLGARRAAGDRLARLRARRRQDRRARATPTSTRRSSRCSATSRSTCPAGRRRSSSSPRATSTRAWSSSSSPPRPSTARTRVCRVVETLAEAEAIAPEHLVLLGEAEALAGQVRNAGAVFVGASSPVAAGDYATGGNHVLPTGGWARSVGGLGLETFLKPLTTQRLTAAGLALAAPDRRGARRAPRGCRRTPRRWRDEGAPGRVPALHLGAAERRGRARSPGIDPLAGRALRPEHAAAAAADARARARSRGALARDQRLSARRLPRAARARSPTTPASSPTTSSSASGADDLILLCARVLRRPRRHDRDPGGADLPALPARGAARRRRGRRRRSRAHLHLPAQQPRRGAAAAARGASARLRRGLLRVLRRDGGRRCSTTA